MVKKADIKTKGIKPKNSDSTPPQGTVLSGIINSLRTDFYVQIVAIVTIIGIILRFYHLDFNSLWLDEAATYTMSKISFFEIWDVMKVGDFHPPLFHWIEHIMLQFGNNEFILRLVPAVLGVLSIPLAYIFGNLVKNEKVGVISAALLAFSPFHIYYSQEAYSYSFLLFIFLIVLIFYLKAIKANQRKYWILVGIVSAIAFWVHFYILIPIVVLYLHAILINIRELKSNFEKLKNILISAIIAIILVLPLTFIVIERYFTLTAKPPTYGVLGIPLIYETFYRFSSFNGIIMGIFIILFVIGLINLFKDDKKTLLLFILMITLPLIFSVIISAKMTMNPRYLIYLLPIYYTGIALSTGYIPDFNSKKLVLIAIITAFFIINIPFYNSYYTGYSKEDWRGFSDILASNTMNGDFVVLVPGYLQMPLDYYYSNSSDGTYEFGAVTSSDLSSLAQKQNNNSIFFIITADITAANPEGDSIEWLQKNTSFAGQYSNIFVYKK